jgi:flagellar biosynthetic protein FlhB
MAEHDGDKQHEATPHRREQAREEGQVARSQDLASATLLLAGLLMLWYQGESLAIWFGDFFRTHLGGQAWLTLDTDTAVERWVHTTLALGWTLVPFLGVLMLVAIAVNLGQTGLLFLPGKVALDISHIDPLQNAKRLFSLPTAMRLAFGLFKLLVVSVVAGLGVWNEQEQLMGLAEREGGQVAVYLTTTTLAICIRIAIALLLLALLDYGFQFWKHEQDLRMTTQELREEIKEQQGDPQILQRRRRVQRELVQKRLKVIVPKADVVVTNPTELAVAIEYDMETMPAPQVVAKGAGVLAQQIRRLALENGIPIVERKELARALYKNVEVGQAVPFEQYAAVAEVLRYVYQLQGKKLPTSKAA